MESEILRVAAGQGIWATLFVSLLFYVLKENAKRENKLQEIINKLSDKLNIVEFIKKDVQEIKEKVEG